jgi:hypothetical protein
MGAPLVDFTDKRRANESHDPESNRYADARRAFSAFATHAWTGQFEAHVPARAYLHLSPLVGTS